MIRFQCRGLAWLGPFFLLLNAAVADEEPARLEPIRVSAGTATEYLQTDIIHPTQSQYPTYSNGSGSLDQSLARDYPVQVLTSGNPGTVTQFRGFGVRSEDTTIQTLGVSLNPAYGGGFDFSTMPAYIWSSYRYQVGPASASFDPRSYSGVVSLTPWTARAVESKPDRFSFQPNAVVSTLGLGQFSAGVVNENSTMAAVAGYSVGVSQGAAGSFSARWDMSERNSIRFHLIATDLTSRVPGTTTAPTPLTTSRTARVLPILTWDHVTPMVVSKLTFYSDLSNLLYRSPEGGFETFDQARVYGANYALGISGWRLGLLGRRLVYRASIPTPDEDLGQFQVMKAIPLGDRFVIEPMVKGTTITGYSVLPEGALGLRYELSQAFRFFGRAAYNRRFPTMADRYYTLSTGSTAAQGNPSLEPETNQSYTLGIETSALGRLENLIQLTYQESQNTHQFLPIAEGSSISSMQGAGNGQMLFLFHVVKVQLTQWFDFTKTFSINLSRLERTRGKFNYLPWGKNVFYFRLHDPSDLNRWSVALIHHWISESTLYRSTGTVTLPSYLVGDIAADIAFSAFRVGFKVENIADTRYQVKENEPVPGRTYIFTLQASL